MACVSLCAFTRDRDRLCVDLLIRMLTLEGLLEEETATSPLQHYCPGVFGRVRLLLSLHSKRLTLVE